eukprot:762734-Hanusia_phi.AAC.1
MPPGHPAAGSRVPATPVPVESDQCERYGHCGCDGGRRPGRAEVPQASDYHLFGVLDGRRVRSVALTRWPGTPPGAAVQPSDQATTEPSTGMRNFEVNGGKGGEGGGEKLSKGAQLREHGKDICIEEEESGNGEDDG